jgi:two-component system, OmpR family, KDP operon response regulator KdpE
VLLDLRLPDLDGIEVVRRLRTWTAVPIVLLSGQGSERARVAALDAGADDFVDKPFSMEELRARVGAMLRRAAVHGVRRPPPPTGTVASCVTVS